MKKLTIILIFAGIMASFVFFPLLRYAAVGYCLVSAVRLLRRVLKI